jgi:RHS repeat-associated protein
MAARYRYDPYSRLLSSSGPLAGANLYRFASKEVNPNYPDAGGYYYFGYRFYDPNLQRWLNRDPLGEAGGINLYAFLRNMPTAFVDPFGEQCLPPILLEPPPIVPYIPPRLQLPAPPLPRGLLPPPRPGLPPYGWPQNPFRPGSFGRINPNTGKFEELWRFDQGKPGKPGWGGIDHLHLGGEKPHLPLDTPWGLGRGSTIIHNAPPVKITAPPGIPPPSQPIPAPEEPKQKPCGNGDAILA